MADDLDDSFGCGSCPVHMLHALGVGFRAHVEAALANWLATMTHTPSCGLDVKGDLVRWQIVEGHRLPTVREDLVEAAVDRRIEAYGIELIAFLANALESRTRETLVYSLAVTQ